MRTRSFGMAAVVVGVLASATGCLTTGDGDKIWADIRAVQAQTGEIQKSLTEQKTRLVELIRSADQRVADLNKKIEQAESILRRSNVDFFQQLQSIQTEISKSSGRIETLERNLDVQKRDLDAFREETTRKIGALAAKPVAPQVAEQPPAPTDPAAAYDEAARELSAARYDKAVDLFLGVLKQFPKHSRMEDIQFGLADAYVGKRDFKQALAEYSRFYQDFGQSERAPEALFKVAKCYEELGDFRTAELSLKVIIKKFKKSSFAKDAKKLLKVLKKK